MKREWFRPILAGATSRDRLVACLGAALCLMLTVIVCARLRLAGADLPVIVAPLGASAVLVFAVPTSPLAQPWPVIGGNFLSTLVGVTVARLVPDVALAAGLAVGAAILAMSLARCLHPPGGAAALTAVIGGTGIHAAGYGFAFAPVAVNSISLVALATLFHRASRRTYPHVPALPPAEVERELVEAGLDRADIDAALAELHESFDIAPEDLDLLLARAEVHAAKRRDPG